MLISPAPNTTYRITPNLDLASQQISVEAAAGGSFPQVTIYVDGNPLQTFSSPPYQTWWQLTEGEHRFWAEGVNANGEVVKSEVVTINVVK